jgi:glycolate oxidase FAD binding subunit
VTEPDRFEQILGAAHVWVPAGESLDGKPVTLVLRPGTPEEVAACLAEAVERAAAVVVTGGGSKLGWGNTPEAQAVVRLDLTRLDVPSDVNPDEGVATVQAGTRVADLVRELEPLGKRTRLETPHAGATVGGTIAADAFGPDVAPERRVRDEVLGLEVALANGSVTRCGGRVVKNVTGFDLVRLYCGSLGTLGVITAATFRLRPGPETRRVLGRGFDAWEPAMAFAAELLRGPADPSAVALRPKADARPEADAVEVLWLLEGSERDVASRAGYESGDPRDFEEWRRVEAETAGGGAEPVRLRLGARPSDTLAVCVAIRELAGAAAVRLALPRVGLVFADLGVGALEPTFERAAARGWTAFAERAPDEVKRHVDVFGPPPDTLPLMRALKRRFDPQRVLSPGRFVGRL